MGKVQLPVELEKTRCNYMSHDLRMFVFEVGVGVLCVGPIKKAKKTIKSSFCG